MSGPGSSDSSSCLLTSPHASAVPQCNVAPVGIVFPQLREALPC